MTKQPVAFMSYARRDNRDKKLTELHDKLVDAISVEVGTDLQIFMDEGDIQWGQDWKARLEESIDEVWFFIPIITPSFFNSKHCIEELQRFLALEEELGSNDLILPIYYRDTPLLNQEVKREADEQARKIHAHQRADWRQLRNTSFDTDSVRSTLEKLGRDFRDAWERVQERMQEPTVEETERTLVQEDRSSNSSVNRKHLSAVRQENLPERSGGEQRVERTSQGTSAGMNVRQDREPQAAFEQVEAVDMELTNWLINTIRFHDARGTQLADEGRYEEAIRIYSGAVSSILPVLESLRVTGHKQLHMVEEL